MQLGAMEHTVLIFLYTNQPTVGDVANIILATYTSSRPFLVQSLGLADLGAQITIFFNPILMLNSDTNLMGKTPSCIPLNHLPDSKFQY